MMSLLDSVSVQEIVQRSVGGQPGQAIDQFKAVMAERTVGTESGPTERRLVNQVQRQARIQSSIIGRFP